MKTIILTNEEAKQVTDLPANGELVIVRVMKPQPPEGWVKEGKVDVNSFGESYCFFVDPNAEVGQHPKEGQVFFKSYHAPYAIGQRLDVRETWGSRVYKVDGSVAMCAPKYVYKSRFDERFLSLVDWQSPATMPAEAGEKEVVMEGIECKRVQKISCEDMYRIFGEEPSYYDADHPECELFS